MDRSHFLAAGAATAAALAGPVAGRAAGLAEVNVSFFPGASAWPMYAGIDGGFFSRAGLKITLVPTAGSIDLFEKLDSGAYDVAHTSIDNPIAYDVGQGSPTVTARDFAAWFGVDDGLLRLVAAPGTAKISDLRGKTLAVDAPTTGYAFALRAMLASAGLTPADVTFVSRGGTAQRYAALVAHGFDATLLTPPYDYQAGELGFVTLGKVTDVVGSYQGISGIARRGWLAAHRDTAAAYLRAYKAAFDSLLKDRDAAVTLFIKYNPGLSVSAAQQTYAAAFAKGSGLHPDASISVDGVRTVLKLRAQYAPPGAGNDPLTYLDQSIVRSSS